MSEEQSRSNYLKAVFWDHSELCDPERVHLVMAEARRRNDRQTIEWIVTRFLERGRVKDCAEFFGIEEIKEALQFVKISPRARKKWERLVEVYGKPT